MARYFFFFVLRREAGSRELVAAGRGAVVLLAGLAFIVALDPNTMVLDLVGYAWAGFGAAFGPVLILSLYWPRMTARGALAGVLTGGITVVVWKQLDGGLFDLYEIVPGFLLSLLAIWIACMTDPSPRTNLEADFNRVRGSVAQPRLAPNVDDFRGR